MINLTLQDQVTANTKTGKNNDANGHKAKKAKRSVFDDDDFGLLSDDDDSK